MTRPTFSFRPNVAKTTHRRAWEVLQNVSNGQKNNFIAEAILHKVDEKSLETMLRRIIQDELSHISVLQSKEQAANNDEIPLQMLDFVGSLFDDK